jgi:gamma-glutamylcyclotransferase (GGCT)/AIG2-like uncharacterized protein YtfP
MHNIRVFVYGTLKQGHGNHRCLDGAVFEGKARTVPNRFKMVSLGAFPAIITLPEGAESAPIKGETYLVDEKILSRLDMLEGYPNLYNRRNIAVRNEEGQWAEALVYYMEGKHSQSPAIESGEW